MTEHLKCPREVPGSSAPIRLGAKVLPVVSPSFSFHAPVPDRIFSFPIKRPDVVAGISNVHPLSFPLSFLPPSPSSLLGFYSPLSRPLLSLSLPLLSLLFSISGLEAVLAQARGLHIEIYNVDSGKQTKG